MASGTVTIIAKWVGDKAQKGVDALDKRLAGINKTTALMASAAIAAGAAIAKQLYDVLAVAARLDAQLKTTEATFERLARKAGTTAASELQRFREITKGTISDLRIMQKVGAAVDAGLTFDQSAIALEFLRRYSLAFGKDFNQLVSTIFTGLQRGSTLLLDDAGIIINTSSIVNSNMNEIEKRAAILDEAFRQMREKLTTLPEITDDFVTQTDNLNVAWEGLTATIGGKFSGVLTTGTSLLARAVNLARKLLEEDKAVAQALSAEQSRLAGLPLETTSTPRAGRPDQVTLGLYSELSGILNKIQATNSQLARAPENRQLLDQLTRQKQLRDFILEQINIKEEKLKSELQREREITWEKQQQLEAIRQAASEVKRRHPLTLGGNPDDPTRMGLRTQARRHLQQIAQEKNPYGDEDVQRQYRDMLRDEAKLKREAAEQARKADQELQMFVATLDGIDPRLGSLAKTILNLDSALDIITNPSSGQLAVLSAGLTVAGTVWKTVNTLFGESNRITEERVRLYRKQAQEAERLAQALRDSISATGEFANSLGSFDSEQLVNEFNSRVMVLERGLGRSLGLIPETLRMQTFQLRQEIDTVMDEGLRNTLDLALNEAERIAIRIAENEANVIIEAREEEGQRIIQSIIDQHRQIIKTLDEQEEIQRMAALRAVRQQFDFVEASLRAQYLPQFREAGGDKATQRVLLEAVSEDIRRLQEEEVARATSVTGAVGSRFDTLRQAATETKDAAIAAVKAAVENIGVPLGEAIKQAFTDAGLVNLLDPSGTGIKLEVPDIPPLVVPPIVIPEITLPDISVPVDTSTVDFQMLRDALKAKGFTDAEINSIVQTLSINNLTQAEVDALTQAITVTNLSKEQIEMLARTLAVTNLSEADILKLAETLSITPLTQEQLTMLAKVLAITPLTQEQLNMLAMSLSITPLTQEQLSVLADVLTIRMPTQEELNAIAASLVVAGAGGAGGAGGATTTTEGRTRPPQPVTPGSPVTLDASMIAADIAQIRRIMDVDVVGTAWQNTQVRGYLDTIAQLLGAALPQEEFTTQTDRQLQELADVSKASTLTSEQLGTLDSSLTGYHLFMFNQVPLITGHLSTLATGTPAWASSIISKLDTPPQVTVQVTNDVTVNGSTLADIEAEVTQKITSKLRDNTPLRTEIEGIARETISVEDRP